MSRKASKQRGNSSTARLGQVCRRRVGIDSGRVVFRDGDYYGRTVNVAARITEYAGPGDVLITEAVADSLPDRARLEELGPVGLKGLREPVTLLHAR